MIEIEGYRILRPLGRGGMSSVYLAVQESVQREVAIKIMSPALLGDPQFGERFLREARIAARLRHPHVVQVHDVGVEGQHHYIAMEYLPGGPVLRRDRPPQDPPYALRAIRQIASALDYAHRKGVVHRDIKPDNILLREDGTAVLTDFGIARASDSTRMTMTGSVVGTPFYMSPEQARGLPLDGRADLYSLGIVLYELLVGRVPFHGDDSLSVGIKHMTLPVPTLPVELNWLQDVMERLLAKSADDRFQDAAQLEVAIEAIEFDRGFRAPRTPTPKSLPPVPSPVPSPLPQTTQAPAPQRHVEPEFGSVDTVGDAPRRQRRMIPENKPRRLWPWLLAAAIVLGIGGALWTFQDTLRERLPQTHSNAVLDQADAALAEGRYSDAKTLYNAALALDPDSQRAREGSMRVGTRALEDARAALARGDHKAARDALVQARAASVPPADADALETELRAKESRESELGALLASAQQALQEGRLDGAADSALTQYQRVLSVAADNPVALEGRRSTLERILQRATDRIAARDVDRAAYDIELVAAIEPGHYALPEARVRLDEARSAGVVRIDDVLAEADTLRERGRYTSPAGANAVEKYRAVLAQDAGNARAKAGLRAVVQALVQRAGAQMRDFQFEQAEASLAQAAKVDPSSADIAAARDRLADLKQRREAIPTRDPAVDQQRTDALLVEAKRALDNGQLLDPPGDSAYDKYRQVLSIDRNNAEANAGLKELPVQARRRFEESISANRLNSARAFVDALETFAPGDSGLADMKRRLARAFVGLASERLGAADLKKAGAAYQNAAELDPSNTELPSLRARLEQAGGG